MHNGPIYVVNIVDECQANSMLVVDMQFRAFSVDRRTPMATILGLEEGQRYALPSPNLQTGIPSFFALSARLAEMPDPGKTMTPMGIMSSI
jgi:hypothetical protein